MKAQEAALPEESYQVQKQSAAGKKSATAFFIAHFDERSTFISKSFREGLGHVSKELSRSIELLRIDDLSADPDLVAAIKKGLNNSILAICDITPIGPNSHPHWNPNVFYELGMAAQLGLPTFIVCDRTHRLQKTTRLPFDIAHNSVVSYDFSPEGLENLKSTFIDWLLNEFSKNKGQISAYEQSQHFVRTAREIKNTLYDWRGASAASFRQLLARLLTPLHHETSKMTRFLKETPGPAYKFEPAGRPDAVEQVFIAMIDSLEQGDEYVTLSTLVFWLGFRDNGNAFRLACIKAAERQVSVRRLLIVPDDPTEIEKELIKVHVRTYKTTIGKYELRIQEMPRSSAFKEKGYGGVCTRRDLGVVTAFQPEYEGLESPRIIGIRLRDDAEDAASEFEERWRAIPALNKREVGSE